MIAMAWETGMSLAAAWADVRHADMREGPDRSPVRPFGHCALVRAALGLAGDERLHGGSRRPGKAIH